ncbi:hypothetical protein K493DRAFT_339015 [Basidiobolus meristosporus CBS 931.73]|uniref:Gamma interferon inducible lysosomal thiol reductase n=1 Tax=Basidiobolus meristosporus CBS 931.73 TaxID=1314790 RepID=A0A1Y1Y2V7_9FUNG|nr:hypothetical protein K493DRAFT_339015 [Basidiobolus meristosporus CBS 931.73]|eukprot:ORX92046.1 hypothetical protein K493DRAFT_339015 [Basidiobolus meristosporus CBS 931.73]
MHLSIQGILLTATIVQGAYGRVSRQSPFHVETFSPPAIPVDLYVMSKCPDTIHCEEVFGGILDKIGSIVNLNVYYIGREVNGSLMCKHGEDECRANKMQLCAKALYRWHEIPTAWFRLIQCQNKDYEAIGADDSLEYCSLREDMSFHKLKECADGPYGSSLLSQSFVETREKGISSFLSTSCTMVINQKVRCVRDSTWKECAGGHSVDDFVRDICDVYKSISPTSALPEGCPTPPEDHQSMRFPKLLVDSTSK